MGLWYEGAGWRRWKRVVVMVIVDTLPASFVQSWVLSEICTYRKRCCNMLYFYQTPGRKFIVDIFYETLPAKSH